MISQDGRWWWNGSEWVSAISADGRWRWDGSQWVLNAGSFGFGGSTRLEDTPDTVRTQTAVIAYQLLALVLGIISLAAVASNLDQYMNSLSEQGSTLDPTLVRAIAQWTFIGAAVLGFAWRALVIAGALLLWRWIYYAATLLGLFSVYSVISNAIVLAGGFATSIHPPRFLTGLAIGADLLDIALATWLLMLWIRYRNAWARTSVPS